MDWVQVKQQQQPHFGMLEESNRRQRHDHDRGQRPQDPCDVSWAECDSLRTGPCRFFTDFAESHHGRETGRLKEHWGALVATGVDGWVLLL